MPLLTVGEVLEIMASQRGVVGYAQVVAVEGESDLLVRVLPGRFADPLGPVELERLVAGAARCWFLVSWLTQTPPVRRGVLPVPAGDVDGCPLVGLVLEADYVSRPHWFRVPGERQALSPEAFAARFGEPSAEQSDRWPSWHAEGGRYLEDLIAEDLTPGEQRRRNDSRILEQWRRSPLNPEGVGPLIGCRFDNGEEASERAERAVARLGFATHWLEILGLDGSVPGIPVEPDQWWVYVRTDGAAGDEERVREAVEAEGGRIAARGREKLAELEDLIEWGWYQDEVRSGHLPLSAVPKELPRDEET